MSRESNRSPNRRTPPRRGFRTADGMILVAVAALGLALSGSITAETKGFFAWNRLASQAEFIHQVAVLKPPSPRNLANALSGFGLHFLMLCVPFLAAVSIGLIPVRLLPPRPGWRRLALQPGIVAAFAAIVAIACVGAFFGTARLAASKGAELTAGDAALAVLCLPIFVGFSIGAAWITLIVSGLWHPEATWIDRLGRIVAVAWIIAGIFNTCHYLIFGLNVSIGTVFIRYASANPQPGAWQGFLAAVATVWIARRPG